MVRWRNRFHYPPLLPHTQKKKRSDESKWVISSFFSGFLFDAGDSETILGILGIRSRGILFVFAVDTNPNGKFHLSTVFFYA